MKVRNPMYEEQSSQAEYISPQQNAADKLSDAAKRTTVSVSGNIISTWTLAFVILKLCHVISWNWWWVLSPVWVPVAAGILLLIVSTILFTSLRH